MAFVVEGAAEVGAAEAFEQTEAANTDVFVGSFVVELAAIADAPFVPTDGSGAHAGQHGAACVSFDQEFVHAESSPLIHHHECVAATHINQIRRANLGRDFRACELFANQSKHIHGAAQLLAINLDERLGVALPVRARRGDEKHPRLFLARELHDALIDLKGRVKTVLFGPIGFISANSDNRSHEGSVQTIQVFVRTFEKRRGIMGITMNVIYNKHIQKILEGLEKETISKVTRAIDLLEIYGEDLKMPNSKRIGHGLLELRIHGKQEIRIFYTLINEEAYLLHLYIKKTQKIPAKEMKTARERLIALNNYH